MIIEVHPDVKYKVEYCNLQLAKHALLNCKYKKDAANFLGICIRTLQKWINRYDELEEWRKPLVMTGNDKWNKLEDGPKWKTKSYE